MTKVLQALLDEFPGNKAWNDYAEFCKNVHDIECKNIPFPYDMIKGISYKFGGRCKEVQLWYKTKNSELGNKTPENVFSNYKYGDIIIKTVIMRMHC